MGCFNIREPESPKTQGDWLSPIEPQTLINNLSKAVTTVNANNYQRCFKTGTFTFNADPDVARNSPGLFDLWNADEEIIWLNNLQKASAVVTDNKIEITDVKISSAFPFTLDSVEYSANYKLRLLHLLPDYTFYDFKGKMIFHMVRNKFNEWEIVFWSDFKQGEEKSWSDLKAHFYSR